MVGFTEPIMVPTGTRRAKGEDDESSSNPEAARLDGVRLHVRSLPARAIMTVRMSTEEFREKVLKIGRHQAEPIEEQEPTPEPPVEEATPTKRPVLGRWWGYALALTLGFGLGAGEPEQVPLIVTEERIVEVEVPGPVQVVEVPVPVPTQEAPPVPDESPQPTTTLPDESAAPEAAGNSEEPVVAASEPEPVDEPEPPVIDECHEDEPCWNEPVGDLPGCAVRGNTVCGPGHGIDGMAMVGPWIAEPTTAWVQACATALGGMDDLNLARCADWASYECTGDNPVDDLRDDCGGDNLLDSDDGKHGPPLPVPTEDPAGDPVVEE